MADIEQLLVGLVTSFRYVGDEINPKLAQSEAEILHDAVKEKKGSYEEAIRVLTTRSKTQLIATFNRYREIHGTSISKVHKMETLTYHQNYHSFLHMPFKRETSKSLNALLYDPISDISYGCRNWWMKDLMILSRHCTPPSVPSMIISSTMKRFDG